MRFGTNMKSQINLNYSLTSKNPPHLRNTEFYNELTRSIQCLLKMFRWTEGGRESEMCIFMEHRMCVIHQNENETSL